MFILKLIFLLISQELIITDDLKLLKFYDSLRSNKFYLQIQKWIIQERIFLYKLSFYPPLVTHKLSIKKKVF